MKNVKFIVIALVALLLMQCKNAGFTTRKYTKGRFVERKDKALATAGPAAKKSNLKNAKTVSDLNYSALKPERPSHYNEEVFALKAPEQKLKGKSKSQEVMSVAFNAFKSGFKSKMSFKPLDLPKAKKSEAPAGLLLGLSIGGMASGIGTIICAIYAIIDSLIGLVSAIYVSPYFFVAFALGLVAIGLSITTLVMGGGDLGRMEKSFATVGIITGGVGLIIAGIWYLIISWVVASI
jgi:hypothetical protein